MNDQPIRRAAMYRCVSTLHQETENQLLQTVRFIEANGWERVELVDHGSGKDAEREKFKELFSLAARREIDIVVVWALDRFSREGVAETFAHIQKLASYGVGLASVTEPHFRTTGPAGELLIAVAAWIAKQERIRISDRVRAGLERARKNGTKTGQPIGRPRVVFDHDAVIALRAQGLSWPKIAQKVGASVRTVRREFHDES